MIRAAKLEHTRQVGQDPSTQGSGSPMLLTLKSQANLNYAAVNGSNRIVLRWPPSSDINALTCWDDLY